MRNMHVQILHHPLLLQGQSENSIIALFEILTDSGFYCTLFVFGFFFKAFSSHIFSWWVISYNSLSGEIIISGVTSSLFSQCWTQIGIFTFLWNPLQIPLSKFQIEWTVSFSVYLRRLEKKSQNIILRHKGWLPVMEINQEWRRQM